jgi:deoxyribonuclease IV
VATRRPVIGAHVSVAGGLLAALPRAEAVGAEVIQIFVANPRGWAAPATDPETDEQFAEQCRRQRLAVFVHAPYLINFGSPSPATLESSSRCLQFSLRRAVAIGAKGVVVHAGSAVAGNRREVALGQVHEHVLACLDSVPEARVLIEPTAGGGGALAADAESLNAYLDTLDRDERVGVCLDTCHMHAAGHDLSSPAGFGQALRAYAASAGRGRIELIHVNDSRDPAGSKRDRHASIGQGTIGRDAFAVLFTSTATRLVPMVVETTDADQATDIAALKQLRADSTGTRSTATRRSTPAQ